MQKLKLPSVRLYELSAVLDNIPPKEFVDLKEIRLASGIVKDLQEGSKEYTDEMTDLLVKQQGLLKEYQARFNEETKELEQKEKDEYVAKMNADFQAEVRKKFKKEFDETDKLALKECEIELSDEKHAKLKDFFQKKGKDSYTKKEALIEVADALGIE